MAILDIPRHLLGWAKDLVPSSSYTTSAKGLTWQQVFNSPLPPYLSPLPVLFRLLAYLIVAPALFLIALDIGGYLVFRIYDQPFWSGTRTAFYKFRTSPVFTRASATSSPTAQKNVPLPASSAKRPGHQDAATALSSQDGREVSISPVSSSASLMGLNDNDDHNHGFNASDLDTTPHTPEEGHSPRNVAKTIPTMAQLNRHIQKRHLQKNASQAGSGQSNQIRGAAKDDNSTPTATTSSFTPYNHGGRDMGSSNSTNTSSSLPAGSLSRSNSLGLGFQSPPISEDGSDTSEVRMYPIFSRAHEVTELHSPPRQAPSDLPSSASSNPTGLANDASPKSTKSSGAASAQILAEDDRAFAEAKEAVSGSVAI